MIFVFTGAVLYATGLLGLFARRDLILRIIAANVASTGAFLVIVALPARNGATADPVAQAMVLTGIVVAVSVTALALFLVGQLKLYRTAGESRGQH